MTSLNTAVDITRGSVLPKFLAAEISRDDEQLVIFTNRPGALKRKIQG